MYLIQANKEIMEQFRKLLTITALALLFSAPVYAEAVPRLVTVTGEADVMTVPDEVELNFQVESFDANLAKAKSVNDESIKQLLAIIKKYQIDPKDFRTDYFTVRNDERYFMDPQTNQQRSKRGYFVSKNVAITLRDISKFEDLYSDALGAGVNNISGVNFKTSQLKKLKDQARTLAVQAAKDKAAKLAAELGQEISQPNNIQENVEAAPWPGPRMGNRVVASAMLAESAENETIALGQIKVSASVTVSFELK
jgi:hypothetical protein